MFIWNYWPGPQGGAERQCRLLARELARRGVDCTVVTRWSRLGQKRREDDEGVAIRRLGCCGPLTGLAQALSSGVSRRIRPARAPQADAGSMDETSGARRYGFLSPFLWIERLFFMIHACFYLRGQRAHFDILHAHETHWLAGFVTWLGEKHGLPVLVKEASFPAFSPIAADVPFHRNWLRWRKRARFIAQTADAAASIAAQGIPDDRIEIIPNGVVIPSARADPGAARDVVYVGNLYQGIAWKAFDVLFQAWKKVAAGVPNSRLILVGGGHQGDLRQMAAELGIMDRLVFTGHAEDPASCFQAAALFVLPSRREGMSNALLEAQSWGVPAVVSDIPANRAVVKQGETALLVDVGQADALADAITLLLRDPARRQSMGDQARSRMKAQFSMAAAGDRVLACYKKICEKSPPRIS